MTTLIIHGTMTIRSARAYSWWQNSWGECGALNGMKMAMYEHVGNDDIWKVNDIDVAEFSNLKHDRRKMFVTNGRFYWSGFNQKEFRLDAGDQLARYLNLITQLSPNESIRIIAHSHGCNVVKACTNSNVLNPSVYISKLCFLACPHFEIPTSN